MNLNEALQELQLFVTDPDEQERSWARQLSGTPSLLLLLLHDLVGHEGLTESLETIRQIWPLPGLEFALKTFYGNRQQDLVDTARIANNARGLIATAVAAAAQAQDNNLLSEWARISAAFLKSETTSHQSSRMQRRSVGAGPIESINLKFDELERHGILSVAARFWSLYWLGDEATGGIVSRRAAIPVVSTGSRGTKVTHLALLQVTVQTPHNRNHSTIGNNQFVALRAKL